MPCDKILRDIRLVAFGPCSVAVYHGIQTCHLAETRSLEPWFGCVALIVACRSTVSCSHLHLRRANPTTPPQSS